MFMPMKLRTMSMGFWTIFVIIVLLGITITVAPMAGVCGYTVTISTPDYNGDGGTTYITKDYYEENGCIIFVNLFGQTKRICGEYTVTDYGKRNSFD